MSDQLVVEREGLEKKDKNELQTIVSALGGNAPARMRKAELIDQILELSGATARVGGKPAHPANGDGSSRPADSESAAQADDATEVDESSGQGRAESGFSSGSGRGGRDGRAGGEPLADWEVEVRDGSGSDQESKGSGNDNQARSKGRNGRGSGNQANQAGNGARTNRNDSNKNNNNRDSNNRDGNKANPNQSGNNGPNGNQGGNNQPNNQGGNGQPNNTQSDEDGEEGNNRRSRRRSRGRGRDRDDAGDDPISEEQVKVEGYLDLRDEGYAFLRVNGFLPSRDDAYVSVKQVRQYRLRKGDHVVGLSRPANRNEKNPALNEIESINGVSPEELGERVEFDELTPVFPTERFVLERPDEPENLTVRVIDLFTPIGKGQRGLIVSPPKAGKTSVIKQIARSIEANNPEVELLVLLVDERPEEVTDMARHLERGEVVFSTFDRPPDEHIAIAEITLERAKRLTENGNDVVLLIDGITRLARAYNTTGPQSGRPLNGGIDTAALYPPKRFLGAARNHEEGGSLTVLATVSVETGSAMDEAIAVECDGTENAELRLDRTMAAKRIFPAIDVVASSTRHEELLRDQAEVDASWRLRRELEEAGDQKIAVYRAMLEAMASTPSNADFLAKTVAS